MATACTVCSRKPPSPLRGNLLPVGLSQGADVARDIAEDEMITYDDVELPDSVALELRRAQDA